MARHQDLFGETFLANVTLVRFGVIEFMDFIVIVELTLLYKRNTAHMTNVILLVFVLLRDMHIQDFPAAIPLVTVLTNRILLFSFVTRTYVPLDCNVGEVVVTLWTLHHVSIFWTLFNVRETHMSRQNAQCVEWFRWITECANRFMIADVFLLVGVFVKWLVAVDAVVELWLTDQSQ